MKRPKSFIAHALRQDDTHSINQARMSTAIVNVGNLRVVRIFVDGETGTSSSWKTIQIPDPCPASFACDLLRMKPTIRKLTTDQYRLVETHGITDMRVIDHEQDIAEIIDSWNNESLDATQFKLIFKDPTKMMKVMKVYLEDDMTKTLAVRYDTTAATLHSQLARRMKLVDTSQYRFILVQKGEGEDLQRMVKPEENLFALISQVTDEGHSYKFYFRDPLTPIRKGSVELISVPYSIPELARFEVISLLGQGGFGKVWKVRDCQSEDGQLMALKVMLKHMVVDREMILHTNIELQMMRDLSHPFVVQLYHSEQSSERLYLAMEFLGGGSLFDLIRLNHGPFTETQARFYAVQIILALEEIHDKKFVYRDLKLENILLDSEGNLRLTDFGLSHYDPSGNGVKSFSGTAIYLAPEILNNQAHGKSVDFWCFGVAMFLLLCQEPPFWHENHKELFEEIKSAEPYWEDHTYLSDAATSLLRGLLEKDPHQRLGVSSIDELKEHDFFKSVDWDKALAKEYTPPFIPPVTDKNAVYIPKNDLDEIFIDTEEHSEIEPEYFSEFSFCATHE